MSRSNSTTAVGRRFGIPLGVLGVASLVASMTLLLSSGAGVAGAHHETGHESNYHGMCTAYFSGSDNGQGAKREHGHAFAVFEQTVGDRDDDGDVDSFDVADFCNEMTGGFGNPGNGNDPSFGDDTCGFDEQKCEDLENQEGGTDPGENNANENPGGGN